MDRYKVIANLAKQKGWTTGAELGVWVGVTTFHLMRNTQLKMYAVDCWEEQPDNPEYDWQYNKKPVYKHGEFLRFEPLKPGQHWDHDVNEKLFRDSLITQAQMTCTYIN